MNTNPWIAMKLAAERQQELQAEAARDRLLADLPCDRSGLARTAAAELGALMVRLGTWLESSVQRDRPVALDS
jgi:hypothetical protein